MPPKESGPEATKKSAPSGNVNAKNAESQKTRIFRDNEFSQTEFASRWNSMCLPLMGTLLFCFAVALIIIGAAKNIEDLIIIGAIFVCGSTIFFGLMYVTVCRPLCNKNQVDSSEYFDRMEPTKEELIKPVQDVGPSPVYSYANPHFDSNEDLTQSKTRPGPSDFMIYGSHKMRSFLATPATATDVHFDDGLDTPPPPRLALPSDYGNTSRSIFTVDVDEDMRNKKDVSDLELL